MITAPSSACAFHSDVVTPPEVARTTEDQRGVGAVERHLDDLAVVALVRWSASGDAVPSGSSAQGVVCSAMNESGVDQPSPSQFAWACVVAVCPSTDCES